MTKAEARAEADTAAAEFAQQFTQGQEKETTGIPKPFKIIVTETETEVEPFGGPFEPVSQADPIPPAQGGGGGGGPPPTTGACCYFDPVGAGAPCGDLAFAELCTGNPNNIWHGLGTTCATTACRGSCCICKCACGDCPGGTCYDNRTYAECQSLRGDGSSGWYLGGTCGSQGCAHFFGTGCCTDVTLCTGCCKTADTCYYGTQAECIGAWTAAGDCPDCTCQPPCCGSTFSAFDGSGRQFLTKTTTHTGDDTGGGNLLECHSNYGNVWTVDPTTCATSGSCFGTASNSYGVGHGNPCPEVCNCNCNYTGSDGACSWECGSPSSECCGVSLNCPTETAFNFCTTNPCTTTTTATSTSTTCTCNRPDGYGTYVSTDTQELSDECTVGLGLLRSDFALPTYDAFWK